MTPTEPIVEPHYRWYHKALAVVVVTFCLWLGIFLVIFPWLDRWDNFAAFLGGWRRYFDNMYVRGAISGIGLINLYISLVEVFRLRRFARH
jgi:hypothetical protein